MPADFGTASLKHMHSYLTDNYQRVRISNSFSLGSLILFKILLSDIFFMIKTIDISSYADHNTPYSVGKN